VLNGRKEWATVGQYGPKLLGLHAAYSGWNNGLRLRKEEPIPEIQPWFGLRVETHPHEDGMASNRVSLSRGECVPAPCTHRPSSHPNVFSVRSWLLPGSNREDVRGAKS
jgi:hypothetical protein